jgi:hypothetical protein
MKMQDTRGGWLMAFQIHLLLKPQISLIDTTLFLFRKKKTCAKRKTKLFLSLGFWYSILFGI